LLRSFLSLEEAGNPESAKDSVRYLQNFRCYVLGVADRNYIVAGRAPVMTVQRDDLAPPEHGFQWCVIKLGSLLLPFVSYAGRRIVWYLGWQPSGIFGVKFGIKQ
jgi:hypothetical protein